MRRDEEKKTRHLKNVSVYILIALFASTSVILYVLLTNGSFKTRIPEHTETAEQTKGYDELLFEESVMKYSEKYSVPPAIIYSVIRCESSFREKVVSPRGAIGLMQLMPSTFEWLCEITGESPDLSRLEDADTNIRYGTMFLYRLKSQYRDWTLAIAAYNAGPGNVNKWLEDERYSDGKTLTYIPITETRNYVEKVKNYVAHYQSLYADKNWMEPDLK